MSKPEFTVDASTGVQVLVPVPASAEPAVPPGPATPEPAAAKPAPAKPAEPAPPASKK